LIDHNTKFGVKNPRFLFCFFLNQIITKRIKVDKGESSTVFQIDQKPFSKRRIEFCFLISNRFERSEKKKDKQQKDFLKSLE